MRFHAQEQVTPRFSFSQQISEEEHEGELCQRFSFSQQTSEEAQEGAPCSPRKALRRGI